MPCVLLTYDSTRVATWHAWGNVAPKPAPSSTVLATIVRSISMLLRMQTGFVTASVKRYAPQVARVVSPARIQTRWLQAAYCMAR